MPTPRRATSTAARPVVRSLLQGRLGNVLFQIAAGISLAKRHDCEFIAIPDANPALHTPNHRSLRDYLQPFCTTLLRNVRIEDELPPQCQPYDEPSFAFREIGYREDILLRGYFQSERYFDAELVRTTFAIDDATNAYIRQKYGGLLARGNVTSISVRRGDYLQVPWLHPPCPVSYYRTAIEALGPGQQFLVMGDDLAWCRKMFRGPRFHFSDHESATVDLYLQTMCNHNIISNSTFSWWGAWLNPNPNKRVFCPRSWFGGEYAHLDTRDIRPHAWTQLDNPLPLECWPNILRHRRELAVASAKRRARRLVSRVRHTVARRRAAR